MYITVFTPTYNRGYIIEKLYKSLQQQTFTDFEWLVVDDGSIDNTKDLFERWTKENKAFSIRYYKVTNGGKHRAINKATDLAKGKLFFIVDSDDYLTEDALENIAKWESSIENKENFCGVSGNRGQDTNDLWGTTFNGDFIDATSLERKKKNITGDKAEAFYTNILKRYKFNEFEGENFLTEATVWNRLAADGYKIRWFNKIIYISNYLNDGLTKNMESIFAKSPKGTAYYIKQQIIFEKCNLKGKFSYYYLYYHFVKSKVGLIKAAENIEIPTFTLVLAICLVKFKKLIYQT